MVVVVFISFQVVVRTPTTYAISWCRWSSSNTEPLCSTCGVLALSSRLLDSMWKIDYMIISCKLLLFRSPRNTPLLIIKWQTEKLEWESSSSFKFRVPELIVLFLWMTYARLSDTFITSTQTRQSCCSGSHSAGKIYVLLGCITYFIVCYYLHSSILSKNRSSLGSLNDLFIYWISDWFIGWLISWLIDWY